MLKSSHLTLNLNFLSSTAESHTLAFAASAEGPGATAAMPLRALGIDGRQRWLTARASDTLPFSPGR